jgi:hypothetical protein
VVLLIIPASANASIKSYSMKSQPSAARIEILTGKYLVVWVILLWYGTSPIGITISGTVVSEPKHVVSPIELGINTKYNSSSVQRDRREAHLDPIVKSNTY